MNNIYYDSNSYNFGLSSRNFEEKINKKQKNIDEFLAVTQDILRDDEYKYQDPITGKLIINASQANIWVSNHVYFMFSIGSIYDKHDFNNLSALLENFDREKEIYLGTIFDTYSYKDEIVKRVEKQIGLQNGNYHLLLVVIAYGKNNNFEKAPEEALRNKGIVTYITDIDEINDMIMEMIAKYGLITEQYKTFREPNRLSVRRDNITDLDSKFNISEDIDWNNPNNRELFSNLQVRSEKENDFAIRQKYLSDKRLDPNCRISTRLNRNDDNLYKRINAYDNDPNMMPFEKGAFMKLNNYIQPSQTRNEIINPYNINEEDYRTLDNFTRNNGIGYRSNMQLPQNMHVLKTPQREVVNMW